MEMSGTEFFRDEMFRGFCRGELFWGLSFQGKNIRGCLGKLYSWGCPDPHARLQVLLYMCSGCDDVGHPG